MSQVQALFVDAVPDEHAVMRVLANRAGHPSISITSVVDHQQAMKLVGGHDILLVGDHGDRRDGLDLIEMVAESHPDVPSIYVIDEEDDGSTRAALLAGASDVVPRSILSPQLLTRSIAFALEHAASTRWITEQRNRTMALIEALPDLVLRLDIDGAVVGTHGRLSEAQAAQPNPGPPDLSALIPDPALTETLAATRRAVHEQRLQLVEFTTCDGLEVEARIAPIRGSEEAVLLLRDVTARNAQRRKLVATIESKDEMLAEVAHELRSPLSAVIGFAQLLSNERENLSDEDVREMLNRILVQANDIQGMVEDLLTAARHDIGRLVVASVRTSLNAQLSQVLESLPEDQLGRITFTRGHGICIADPNRVKQICRNLVSNALRYGGPIITIHSGSAGETVYLDVIDNGPGVAPDRLDHLFTRYAPDPRNTDSVGLGLALSRDLAQMMQGDLVYERIDGRTCFRLSLPARMSADPGSADDSGAGVHRLDVGGVLLEDDTPLQLQ